MKSLAFLLLLTLAGTAAAQVTDPRITSWRTTSAAAYARVWETAADKSSNNAVSTWPRAGLTNGGGGQATSAYSDVQRVAYSANYVYIYTTGLASYTMGNWLTPNAMTYTSWPTNRGAIHRLPRTPVIPTTKQKTNGSGGIWVNGVFLWSNGDAQSYTTSTGIVSMAGQGIWNRLAGVAEAFNFDTAYGHQPSSGAYHNHINPIALRYQLGDNVTYNSSSKAYAEGGTPTRHSPILGWANDGLPVYGPYGYSTALNAGSGVRRMTSGFQKRDGTNGTTNLAVTGRTTLPVWSASVQGKGQTLASSEYGPATTATYSVGGGVTGTYSIGLFAEDYEYLGDLGKTQGVDFDLNRQNVRYCVTPEYPGGTYAYFVSIDAAGGTVFPDVINQEFFGTAAPGQGTVTSISEAVTDYALAGPAAAITVTAVTSVGGPKLTWNSAEGATYKIESSPNNSTWTVLSSATTSAGLTTTYTATAAANYFRVTLTAMATYDTSGTYGTPVGTSGTASYSATAVAPAITSQPVGLTVTVGGSASFTVVATGTATLGYQWSKDGAAISGATSATYAIASAQYSQAGSYTCVVTNSGGSVTSAAAVLSVTAASGVGTGTARIINISTRALIGGSAGTPVAGFVISGTGAKRILVRAIGPTLASYGVAGTLPDPSLSLVSGGTTLVTNDNWLSTDSTTFSSTGAFALLAGSKDAALVTTLSPGVYSAPVGDAGGSGVTLLEVYDADTTATSAALANASTRAYVGTGDSVLIPGFVVSGTGSVQLLIRAVGPTLGSYGVAGTLADPTLTLYQGTTALATNDNWGSASNASALASTAQQVGAFALTSSSKDAALLVTLGEGSYSAVVSGVGNTTGTALVEIYVVP